MKINSGLGLCIFASQAGATFKTFNSAQFEVEVAEPIQRLLEGTPDLVQKVLVAVVCNPAFEYAEVCDRRALPGEGLGEHVVTPTGQAVLQRFKGKGPFGGRVESLNLALDETHEKAGDRAAAFLEGMGVGRVIVVNPDAPCPSAERIPGAVEAMKRYGVTRIFLACPVHIDFL